MKISLPDVTLCAIDSANISLARRALDLSMVGCSFGDVLFVTGEPITASYRTLITKPFADIKEVEEFWIEKLPQHIKTSFVLFVQYDGYIINPSSWHPEFLDYDYIGAKWAWHEDGLNVGNSGFSLISKNLLSVWGMPEINPSRTFTDEHLCRVLRPKLESEYDIRFAPEAIADLFSYENSLPRQPTFGFHGIFNLWRHNDDIGMEKIANEIAEYTIPSLGYIKVIAQCYLMRRFPPLRAFYRKLQQKLSTDEILQQFIVVFNEPFARECIAVCENLVREGSTIEIPALTTEVLTDIKQPNQTIDTRGRLFPWER